MRGSKLGELWKYRVGDFRILSSIEDRSVRIIVLRIGNRKDFYKEQAPPHP